MADQAASVYTLDFANPMLVLYGYGGASSLSLL
jgi:hypothetical protein